MMAIQPYSWRVEQFADLSDPDTVARFLRLLNGFSKDVGAALSGGRVTDGHAFSKTVDLQTGSPWIAPTLGPGWAPQAGQQQPGYCHDASGWVQLSGAVTYAAVGGTGSTIFTLPAGYRPAALSRFGVDNWTGSAVSIGEVYVDAAGAIVANVFENPSGGGDLKLNGIEFLAEPVGPTPPLMAKVNFRNTLTTKPLAVLVASAADITDGVPGAPVALGGVAWATTADQVLVTDVAGMAPGRKYRVAFLVLG